MEMISYKLREQNVSPSLQRIEIYRYLIDNKNHPTVDMIYRELHKKIPTLSKTTVYNTLNLFVSKGLAIEITIDKNEIRYDADTSIHAHFMCDKCNTIHDLRIDVSSLDEHFFHNAEVKEHHIYFKGTCNNEEFENKLHLS